MCKIIKHQLIASITIVLMLLISSCENYEEYRIKQSVRQHMERYPHSTLCDIYKNFCQDDYGPGHLLSDITRADNYLRNELQNNNSFEGSDFEPTGYEGNFYRVNLRVIADGRITYDKFFDAFVRSAQSTTPPKIEWWKEKWYEIEQVILDMELQLPELSSDHAKIKTQLEQGTAVMHHSSLYNSHYAPHYRIIKRDIFFEEILPLIKR